MLRIDASGLDHRALNDILRSGGGDCVITGCLGQRFIAAGMSKRSITIEGVPGNGLGAYLNGAEIIVNGNAQDAVGDTMNEGRIIIHGHIGDAAGYAMRGGKILIRDDAGYRAGIHMKEYREKVPVMVIGGCAGSFLGEYQAGGIIVVLGLDRGARRIVGNFPCTGMHGGKMYLRGDCGDVLFPSQVTVSAATERDMEAISGCIREFCAAFGLDPARVLDAHFTVVTPDSRNPYQQMYVPN